MRVPRKSDLSPARRRLVELMQQINYGQIEGLEVRGGEPVFDPRPGVRYEVKLGAKDSAPRPESAAQDFHLKPALVALFERFDELVDVKIERVEVQGGLPFKLVYCAEGKPTS